MTLPGNEPMPYGQRLMRIGVTPSHVDDVDDLRQVFADLIDRVSNLKANPTGGSVAMDPVELGIHQSVKAQAVHYLHVAAMLAMNAATPAVEPVNAEDMPQSSWRIPE